MKSDIVSQVVADKLREWQFCRASRKRLRVSLAQVTEWLKAQRHLPVRQLIEALTARLRGHYNSGTLKPELIPLPGWSAAEEVVGKAKSEEPDELGEVWRLAEAISGGGTSHHGVSASADGV